MGPEVTTKTYPKPAARTLPASVADVALIAADTCAAIGEMSVSWWHDEVRTGEAPKPVIQQPRFTRWRLTDVRLFWQERADRGAADTEAAERMTARATKASIKAREPAAVAKAQATRMRRIATRDEVTT
jgi:predicted DNA-binding transcriptional regulator AlpA